MIQQVLAELDYSTWAEGALVLFAVAFVAIVVHTLRADRGSMQTQAGLALEDAPGESVHE